MCGSRVMAPKDVHVKKTPKQTQKTTHGASLVVQWLRLPLQGGVGSIPQSGKQHMPCGEAKPPPLPKNKKQKNLKDVHVLILRACEYIRLCGKGEIRIWMELTLLINWFKIGRLPQIIWFGPMKSQGSLSVEEGFRREKQIDSKVRTWLDVAGFESERMGP